jgi:protoporphyrinogen/coproporphyrinogen III oxidase
VTTRSGRHVVVVGGGITGLACAHRVLSSDPTLKVTVLEARERVGGLIKTTPFAGHAGVDEAADAFLLRNPTARALALAVGLGASLTSPATGHASVWHTRLHPLPEGLFLGVPQRPLQLARTRLISTKGKLRAALEPIIPATSTDGDNLGAYMRRRLGNEVHQMLIDPLVGSIYAADTDHFSLRGMPQLAELANEGRSLLLTLRKRPKPAPVGPSNPVFAAPLTGMQTLVDEVRHEIERLGGAIVTGRRVTSLGRTSHSTTVQCGTDHIDADDVVLCSPAKHTANLIRESAPRAASLLAAWEHASVVMVTLAVPKHSLPRNATGSGYLVPKPEQRFVTAVSFASQKWAHLDDGDDAVLRVSLGRDGVPMHEHDDDELISYALADLKLHLGVDLSPSAIRLSRWVEGFPQYRPGHFERISHLEAHLASELPNVHVAGASYRGIGIPACIEQANEIADRILRRGH